MKTYRLTKTELKNGKFLYEVKDENNNTISKRTSTRHYAACTIDGSHYFGRVDLIGKGDHGRLLAQAIVAKSYTIEQWEKDRENYHKELNKCIAIERSLQRRFKRDDNWLEKYIAECQEALEMNYPIAEREEQVKFKRERGLDMYERMSNIAYLEA